VGKRLDGADRALAAARVVDPEITEPVDWWLTATIPFALMRNTSVHPAQRHRAPSGAETFSRPRPRHRIALRVAWSFDCEVLRFHQREVWEIHFR